MLLNDLYTIERVASESTGDHMQIDAVLIIKPDHSIFRGHFPGKPVLPGVCMLQIIKEMVGHQLSKKVSVASADSLKFLAVVNPEVNHELHAQIKVLMGVSNLEVEARLFYDQVTFFKMKAVMVYS